MEYPGDCLPRTRGELNQLRAEVAALRSLVIELRAEVEVLRADIGAQGFLEMNVPLIDPLRNP